MFKDFQHKGGVMGSSMLLGFSGFTVLMAVNSYGGEQEGLMVTWEIFNVHSISLVMAVYLDWMAWTFMGTVCLISGLILIYTDQYMEGDSFLERFVVVVALFVVSMMLLIISPNLVSVLLGWDGLGLVSYCLVIFYQSSSAYSAGMLTALSNRVGDVFLLMGIAWMMAGGGWTFTPYSEGTLPQGDWMEVVGILVVVAALTKSAQIPFSAWLPAAMAAPTPVSSLVHSSTLVTAGVYLLIRFHGYLEDHGNARVLLLVGGLTMFMAGVGAVSENDLKKVIALSTLSQLGLMMAILGAGYPLLAFFHLITHALFKALLFMCAGNFIHCFGDVQDIRSMGGMNTQLPVSSACFAASNMALCGLPFLAGFYSKDLILETMMISPFGGVGWGLFFLATGFTVSYTVRLLLVTVSNPFKGKGSVTWGEENWSMILPMMVLTSGAVGGGAILAWACLPTPFPTPLPGVLKGLISIVILSGGFLGAAGGVLSTPRSWKGTLPGWSTLSRGFTGSMWFLPGLSTGNVNDPCLRAGRGVTLIEAGWGEVLGPQGLTKGLKGLASLNSFWEANTLKGGLMMFGGLVLGVWVSVGFLVN